MTYTSFRKNIIGDPDALPTLRQCAHLLRGEVARKRHGIPATIILETQPEKIYYAMSVVAEFVLDQLNAALAARAPGLEGGV